MLAGKPLTGTKTLKVCRFYFYLGFLGLPWLWGALYFYFSHFIPGTSPVFEEDNEIDVTTPQPHSEEPLPAAVSETLRSLSREASEKRSRSSSFAIPVENTDDVDESGEAAYTEDRVALHQVPPIPAAHASSPPLPHDSEVFADTSVDEALVWYVMSSKWLFIGTVIAFAVVNILFAWFLPPDHWLWNNEPIMRWLLGTKMY